MFEDASIEKLYDFRGGIYPSQLIQDTTEIQEIKKTLEGGFVSSLSPSAFRKVKSMRAICVEFIENYLRMDLHNAAVMDQYLSEFSDLNVPMVDVAFYQDEVHYIVNPKAPFNSIREALKDAECCMWQLLVVLTSGLELPKKSLDEHEFEIICKNLKYIITTCYDREGYLFWEKKSNS